MEDNEKIQVPEFVMIRKDVLHGIAFILMYNRYAKLAHKQLCLRTIPDIGHIIHSMSCDDTEKIGQEENELAQERLAELVSVFEGVSCKNERLKKEGKK